MFSSFKKKLLFSITLFNNPSFLYGQAQWRSKTSKGAVYINLGEILKAHGKTFLFPKAGGGFLELSAGNVTIYPIKVIEQRTAIGGLSGNFTCGFHSLRNATLFLQLVEDLKKSKSVEETQGILATANSIISNKRLFNDLMVGTKAAAQEEDQMAFAMAAPKSWVGFARDRMPDFKIGADGGLFATHQRSLIFGIKKKQVENPIKDRELLTRVFFS